MTTLCNETCSANVKVCVLAQNWFKSIPNLNGPNPKPHREVTMDSGQWTVDKDSSSGNRKDGQECLALTQQIPHRATARPLIRATIRLYRCIPDTL